MKKSNFALMNLFYRFRFVGRNDRGIYHCEQMRSNPADINNKLDSVVNKPSPAFVVFADAQTQLLPLTKREGNKNRKELINLSTYPLINFNKIYPRPLRDTSRTGELESRVRLRAVWLRARERGKKAAFTLAETLITLGIIGFVAAMTIPTLIAEQQKKQTVAKLQRALGIINQAYRLAYDDIGEANAQEAFEMGAKEYFNKFWAPYIKTTHFCEDLCGYKNGNPYFDLQNKTVTNFGVGGDFRANFYTADGFLYVIYTIRQNKPGSFVPIAEMTLDINGAAPPNKLGKDVFRLIRMTDGEKGGFVAFEGRELTDERINNDCKPNGIGFYCAERIRRAGWKIDKSYPW